MHGYDPDLPSMRALFLARGPSFRRGAVVPGFENVHLYPLLAALLGVAAGALRRPARLPAAAPGGVGVCFVPIVPGIPRPNLGRYAATVTGALANI